MFKTLKELLFSELEITMPFYGWIGIMYMVAQGFYYTIFR